MCAARTEPARFLPRRIRLAPGGSPFLPIAAALSGVSAAGTPIAAEPAGGLHERRS
jgi:hypothetical protein